jgi:hypothetical protein
MIRKKSILNNLLQPLAWVVFLSSFSASAQVHFDEKKFLDQLVPGATLPSNLLSTKTLVLHSFSFTDRELQTAQEYFQKTGIDAVVYFPIDMVLAGKDVSAVFADQFVKREISNLLLLIKTENDFSLTFTTFNGKPTIVDPKQASWTISNKVLTDALKSLQRTVTSGYKKTNLLINAMPESGDAINPILGKRNEFYAGDMKVDLVAIPKFGDETMDKELEEIISTNFPFKYKLTEPGVSEKDLRKQGIFYVLCFIHTRAKVAQELLGYNTGKSETAVVSVTYPEGTQQLKNIPSNTPVYKIYFKHIDSGNVFLGTKWDADLTWQSALLNQIRGMKTQLRLN